MHHLCAKNFTRYFHKQRKKLLPPGTYTQINKQDLGGTKRVITSLKELKTKKVDCTLREDYTDQHRAVFRNVTRKKKRIMRNKL